MWRHCDPIVDSASVADGDHAPRCLRLLGRRVVHAGTDPVTGTDSDDITFGGGLRPVTVAVAVAGPGGEHSAFATRATDADTERRRDPTADRGADRSATQLVVAIPDERQPGSAHQRGGIRVHPRVGDHDHA